MIENQKNLLFVGVGGQGVLLAAEVAARVAIHAGFDVKKTEVHGAAQRGGSVVSHVRFAPKVYSPLCSAGEVDIMLALEKLEALRWAHLVKKGGLMILNDEARQPAQIDVKPVEYPDNIDQFLTKKGFNVVLINATEIANSLGNYRAANTILLGGMAEATGIELEHWYAVMKETLNPKILDLNIRAFDKGREFASQAVSAPALSSGE
ncbi:MAG: indolepyruvate oxidoreductase subunit beta [Bacteroidota bacterium]